MNDSPLQSSGDEIPPDTLTFYRQVLQTLNDSNVPVLVGGAYAFNCYTAISRRTKDLDLFIRRRDYERIDAALRPCGYRTELVYPHWLAKTFNTHGNSEDFVDIIFSSGNGVAEVDDLWFEHADDCNVFDVKTKLCPVEEMIWSKAFVMERERFDGADISHLVLTRAGRIDWRRLLSRFEPHWRILLAHLVLFGFAYPGHRDLVPVWVMNELLDRLRTEINVPAHEDDICAGTLLSREQYLMDIEQWGYRDARIVPLGNMTPGDTTLWTEAIWRQNKLH